MVRRMREIVDELGSQLLKVPQPIHFLSIYSGGKYIKKFLAPYLKKKGIKANFYGVRLDRGKSKIVRTSFKKKDYKGSIVILDDITWTGTTLIPVRDFAKKMNPKKRYYVATLLDCNGKADFSVFK